jgi:L-ascorbate metabolism protein UlaG (beta-lactamase superfamily)
VAEWAAVLTTHFGHSCLLLDTGAARLLIDPGTFSTGFESLRDLDAVIANNSYLVDGTHLHPGDAYAAPAEPVDVLFLPTGAPWLKVSEAVDYLRAVAPRTAVPIHEAVLARPAVHYGLFEKLGPTGTAVRVLDRETPTDV